MSDPGRAVPGKTLGEHPPHMPSSDRVRFQLLQPAPPPRMRSVRMRPGIDQTVAVGRTTTQEAALLHHLNPHRCQHTKPRPQHLPFGLRTQQHRECSVSRIRTVDRSVGLR
jgi:hypothetical protein